MTVIAARRDYVGAQPKNAAGIRSIARVVMPSL
jgi:hypothetical protein